MDLATHQRKLLGLIRSSYQVGSDDDSYIRTVAQSGDLEEARRNVFLWRMYVLERSCILTFTLLKRRKVLTESVCAFIRQQNISPFRETQAPAFLEMLSAHDDALIASVAQFELALMKVRQGDSSSYTVSWNVEPYSILNSVAKDLPIDDRVPKGQYQILISQELPALFQIVRLSEVREASAEVPINSDRGEFIKSHGDRRLVKADSASASGKR